MSEILIIYSTTDGHTREICSRLRDTVEKDDNAVTLVAIEDAGELDLEAFNKIVIGASIRYGKHSAKVYKFIDSNINTLDKKANAFFSVNVVARKPEKNQPATNPYLKKFLRQISWKPKELAVFAGKIDYQKYRIWDRYMIMMIMWMTNGPTDPEANIEFTDWNQVNEFAQTINKM
jgi:menaquinone-dependent protoporphyrinogen oxidase